MGCYNSKNKKNLRAKDRKMVEATRPSKVTKANSRLTKMQELN